MHTLTTLMLLAGLASAVLTVSACKPQSESENGPQSGGKKPVVVMETSLGAITIELDAEKAPITVENFLRYVDDQHYDGTIFHRVISNFMIQGGGMEPGMREKPTRPPIKNESGNGLSNVRGAVAMARTNDLNSATAQFYINVVDNPDLDTSRYCVFGKVIDGMDVADKIRRIETGRNDVPTQVITINSVRRVEKEESKPESGE